MLASLLIALTLCCAGLAPQDELVGDFEKYFKKFKDTPTRVEAVLALEDLELAGVVEVLVKVVPRAEPEVRHAVARVLAGFETRPPIEALLRELEDNRNETVRLTLLGAIEQGGYTGAEPVLVELLRGRSWPVRHAVIRALCATALLPRPPPVESDGKLEPVLPWGPEQVLVAVLPSCADREPAVRCAALEGLASLGAAEVLEPARAALSDDVWQVRACAIRVLGRVRDLDSIPPLIARMELEQGRLLEDLADALAELTGRNFGEHPQDWKNFWATFGERFVMPTDAEMVKLRERRAVANAQYNSSKSAFHGIATLSRRIVFVIDVSGSMESLMVERERFGDLDYPSYSRIDIVKTELARTIGELEPYVEFNILAFATDVQSWKKKAVKANVLNRSSAQAWVSRLEAIGGSSKGHLADAGLSGLANLEGGKTNTYGALMAALGAPAPGQPDDDYEVDLDTLYFLSDGRPSHGLYVDPDDILREVRQHNALRQVVLHTIALGEFDKTFMLLLAQQNGGTFVDLGR